LGKFCKKCGYERLPEDNGPDYACPKCGAVYAKVEALLKKRATADNSTQASEPPQGSPSNRENDNTRPKQGLARLSTVSNRFATFTKRVAVKRPRMVLALTIVVSFFAGFLVSGLSQRSVGPPILATSSHQPRTAWPDVQRTPTCVLLLLAAPSAKRPALAQEIELHAARWRQGV